MDVVGAKSPHISIVIRCYNEERHIGRLLTGILEQSLDDYEIIVVDSGSTDATLSIAKHYPVTIVHVAPDEFSFGRALNRGCSAASGEFLVFASAHVYPVFRDWLEQLLCPFVDENVAIVYGRQRGDGRTRYSEHRVFATWFPESSTLDQKHPFCNNANAAVRRSVWEYTQFDETLTGLEDIDFSSRSWRPATGSRMLPRRSVHVHQESPKGIYNRYKREAMALARIQPTVAFGFLGSVGSQS